jgi:hypothetical protein
MPRLTQDQDEKGSLTRWGTFGVPLNNGAPPLNATPVGEPRSHFGGWRIAF